MGYDAEAVAATLEEKSMTRAFQIAYVDLDTACRGTGDRLL